MNAGIKIMVGLLILAVVAGTMVRKAQTQTAGASGPWLEFEKPLPTATATSRPFWEALTRHEVHIQQCSACEAWIYYPRAFCPECLSPELAWTRISGNGTLYSFTIARRPTAP